MRPPEHICLRDWGQMDDREYREHLAGLRWSLASYVRESDDARPSQKDAVDRRRDAVDLNLRWALASNGAVVLRRRGECTCSDEQADESSKKISAQWPVAEWFKAQHRRCAP